MQNRLKLTFAGQAGFILETSLGYRIGIDLYLSDCCERNFGFKRLMQFIYDPLKMDLDLAVATSAPKQTIIGDYNLTSLNEVFALMNGNGSGRVQR